MVGFWRTLVETDSIAGRTFRETQRMIGETDAHC